VYPIITKITGKQIDLSSIISEETSMQASSYTEMGNSLILAANAEVEKTYIDNIKEDIKKNIENKGYVVNDVSIDIETKNQDSYGQINKVSLNITVGAPALWCPDNNINTVQPIEKVNINNTNDVGVGLDRPDNNPIPETQIDSLKNFIQTTYGVKKENIFINS